MILTVTMNPSIDKIYFVNDFRLGEVHRPTDMIASPGGKGLNVARVAKLMGEVVGATGPLGGGNGDFIQKGVVDLGIKSLFCPIAGESRICVNVSDVVNQHSTEVLEAGPVISEEEAAVQLKLFTDLMNDTDVVTMSGSMAKGLPTDYYGQLIQAAKDKGVRTLLDSSGEAFVAGVKAKPYAIKPNEDEIKKVYHEPVETIEDKMAAIRFFKNEGIELPIISMGKDGSLAGLSDGIYKVSIPSVKVVNTVGSGDSFIAGLAIGLQRGLDEQSMLKMATACGTANTQYAQTGFVEPDVVDGYYKQVTVEKIAEY